ncbi:MAG TPA: S-adenosylmethionine:tRNA ribosyltransferase-isomerase [Longimicrobium sp.]|nr:S-adenosylmethionine:tRNA ribosyltransferase-isomerase [Longimicrobium sp.]
MRSVFIDASIQHNSLLRLVSAVGGYELVMRAYRDAISRGYRFYRYGDAMLVV